MKLGHVALDGTKVRANASKHKAMSYKRMKEQAARLAVEVAELLRRAQEPDDEEDHGYGKDKRGDELPEELAFREGRLRKIREAKAALEAEAARATNQPSDKGQAAAMHEAVPKKCRLSPFSAAALHYKPALSSRSNHHTNSMLPARGVQRQLLLPKLIVVVHAGMESPRTGVQPRLFLRYTSQTWSPMSIRYL